jgi:hypothetical protein
MKFIIAHTDFLNEKLFHHCVEYSNYYFDNLQSNNYQINKDFWEYRVVKDSDNIYVNVLNKNDKLYLKIEAEIIEKLNIEYIKAILFYWYMPCSHIPWHYDKNHNGAITIYLNNDWNRDNGGLFLFEDETNDIIKAIVPKRNMAVHQFGGVHHSVCPLTMNSEIRKTIQIFY